MVSNQVLEYKCNEELSLNSKKGNNHVMHISHKSQISLFGGWKFNEKHLFLEPQANYQLLKDHLQINIMPFAYYKDQ